MASPIVDPAVGQPARVTTSGGAASAATRYRPLVFAMTGAHGLCGGIAAANRNVLRALAGLAEDNGTPLHVLSLLERAEDHPPQGDGFEYRAFAGDKLGFSKALLRLSLHRPTICFDHVTLALPVLPLAATGFLRTVIFAHGSEAWRHVRQTSRWSFRHATLTLTNSEFTLRKMQERIGRFCGQACPLGLAPEFDGGGSAPAPVGPLSLQAADGRQRPLGDRVLLLVGRLDPREMGKGHEPLLNVLPDLLQEHSRIQLVFVGSGEKARDVTEAARRLGVAHAVFLPGQVSVEQLKRLYRHCYAFTMPSRQEGFGLVYLEAMSFSRPCLGCSEDGAEDIIVHGETGLLVRDPDNREELLVALRSLVADPDWARVLGENGLLRLRERFSAEAHQHRVREKLAPLLQM